MSMKRKSATKKGVRMGTNMRGALQKAYGARGGKTDHLFHTYSLKMQRDVVIEGNLRFLNFLLVESDPEVMAVN